MSNEDFFKPLYKQHRRIKFDELTEVLDPRTTHSNTEIAGYKLSHEGNRWTCESLPGLLIIHDFLSIEEQQGLVKESVVDFLNSPEHLTNLDAHHEITRPIHLFKTRDHEAGVLPPKDALIRDKIRWVTLGGQYNWTDKVYPSFEKGTPGFPEFPQSLAKEVAERFDCIPEAAIVNYYKDGDILSPHQDVAELTRQDLVSVSLGCTCIFYLAVDRYDSKPLPIILRSGDILIMGGESRFAFHGVGRVFANTTPHELTSCVDDPCFPEWIMNHRVNINVRQMRDHR